jgi:hypothetical protein
MSSQGSSSATLTARGAVVTVEAVAVVAGLAQAREPVAAARGRAKVRALLGLAVTRLARVVHHVVAGGPAAVHPAARDAELAGLARLDQPVAAGRARAHARAQAVVRVALGEVARLVAADHPVAAGRRGALAGAAVILVEVAVVAQLAVLHHAVAAARPLAGVAAGVAVVAVAVVAVLRGARHAVAADVERAVEPAGAEDRVELAGVALLVAGDDPVTTHGGLTGRRAGRARRARAGVRILPGTLILEAAVGAQDPESSERRAEPGHAGHRQASPGRESKWHASAHTLVHGLQLPSLQSKT